VREPAGASGLADPRLRDREQLGRLGVGQQAVVAIFEQLQYANGARTHSRSSTSSQMR
jgi:hypothetical protein